MSPAVRGYLRELWNTAGGWPWVTFTGGLLLGFWMRGAL